MKFNMAILRCSLADSGGTKRFGRGRCLGDHRQAGTHKRLSIPRPDYMARVQTVQQSLQFVGQWLRNVAPGPLRSQSQPTRSVIDRGSGWSVWPDYAEFTVRDRTQPTFWDTASI